MGNRPPSSRKKYMINIDDDLLERLRVLHEAEGLSRSFNAFLVRGLVGLRDDVGYQLDKLEEVKGGMDKGWL